MYLHLSQHWPMLDMVLKAWLCYVNLWLLLDHPTMCKQKGFRRDMFLHPTLRTLTYISSGLINCILLAFDICFTSEFPKPIWWINPSIIRCIKEVSKAGLVRWFGTFLTEQLALRHQPKSTSINLSMPGISTFMRPRVMGHWTDLLLRMTCGYRFYPRFLVFLHGSGSQRKYKGKFESSIQQLLPSVIWTFVLQMGRQPCLWIPQLVL